MFSRSTLCAFLLLAVIVPARAGYAQLIRGTVREDPSGLPVAGAAVLLIDAEEGQLSEVLTDDEGEFSVHPPAQGTYRLSVSRIGYAPAWSEFFLVGPDDEPTVEIHLTVQPVPLDSLEVVGEPRNPQMEIAGFYKRMEKDLFGHFILMEEIERRSPQRVTDLLYGVPGVRVISVNSAMGEYDVIMRGWSGCIPTVVLDGLVVRGGGIRRSMGAGEGEVGRWNELVHPSEIEAIEVYPSPAGAPVQYGGFRGPCGTILIWTRR